jgi:hypothetical protein
VGAAEYAGEAVEFAISYMRKTLLLVVCAALPAIPQDATAPGDVTAPYPTIRNLSIEWKIQGDDNLNGRVTVQYRRAGDEAWQEGMPLRRIRAGDSGNRTRPTFSWDNRHSGSVFDLRPNTEYEIRLNLTDPDGGSTERTVRARTRGVPRPAPGARVKQANPNNFREIEANAEAGDIIQLTPGYYESFTATRDGVPGRPIVIRGDTSHVVRSTFDGISLEGRKHIILEKLTVNGRVSLLGAEEVAVRHCMVNAKYGITASRPPGCKNCYVADNVVTYTMPWTPEGMGDESIFGGEGCVGEGIQITGPGNVICYNRVRGYRDCISTMEDRNAHEQVSVDIYNNDIYVGADDGIEADFCMGNCRVMRNRLTNCFMGLSSQPSLGGPTYFIRNAMYNIIDAPFKLSRGSLGDVILHNTVVKVGDGLRMPHGPTQYGNSYFRNNLSIGGKGGGKFGRYGSGAGRAIFTPATDPLNDLDYDGVGTHGTPFEGQIGRVTFIGADEMRRLTTEKHGVQVDLSVFESVEFPDPPLPERNPADLRLRGGSAAIDAGARLPNVNDGFGGKAPDLGAYEFGQAPSHYGPRPEGMDEETFDN